MPKGYPVHGHPTPMQRFVKRVVVAKDTDSGCWLWRGKLNQDGYARFKTERGLEMAHRFSYRRFNDVVDIPDGLEADHICRVRHCVNPSHLRAVSHAENMRGRDFSKTRAIHAARTHCPAGHPYSGSNLYLRPDGKGRDCRACRHVVSQQTSRRRKEERRLRRLLKPRP